MTPTLRAELDRIEDFLMGPEGEDLGNILSALRGPDDYDPADRFLKGRTTIHIRATAFPRLLASCETIGESKFNMRQGWQMTSNQPFDTTTPISSLHFRRHVCEAATTLGLVSDPEADARR